MCMKAIKLYQIDIHAFLKKTGRDHKTAGLAYDKETAVRSRAVHEPAAEAKNIMTGQSPEEGEGAYLLQVQRGRGSRSDTNLNERSEKIKPKWASWRKKRKKNARTRGGGRTHCTKLAKEGEQIDVWAGELVSKTSGAGSW